jgi:crossover junction endodeoxyribonuclease RuvC
METTMTSLLEAPSPQITGYPSVIGLDLAIGSSSSTGTGIASSLGWCESVGYPDRKKRGREFSNLPHHERLHALVDLRQRITDEIGCPDLVVLELPAPSRAGGGSHERAWLWWEMYRWLTSSYVPVALLTPNQRALYATGKGNAPKTAVVDAVARRWPDWSTGGDDNLADAVTLMAAGRDHLGHPITDMPKAHRAALDKAIWPDLAVAR